MPREKRQAFIQRLASELGRRTGARFTEAFRTSHVLFLLVAQDRHAQRFREVAPLLSKQWSGQIEAMGLANWNLGTDYENMKITTGSTQK